MPALACFPQPRPCLEKTNKLPLSPQRLLVDEEIGHFFEAESLPKHKAIVARFLIGAMGGPNEYKGRK
jgi:hypothetical protein